MTVSLLSSIIAVAAVAAWLYEEPKTYEKPFKNTRVLSRMQPGQELMEYVCMENKKDLFEGLIIGH